MDAITGLVSLLWLVLKWLGWKIVCGYVPGFRMYALHRWPADIELGRNSPQWIPDLLDVSGPAPAIRSEPVFQPQPPPAAGPSAPPPRSTFRIVTDPIRYSPPPAAPPARVVSDPPRSPRNGAGPRLRTKGPISAPGKCPRCLTIGKVVSAGGKKWRCLICDSQW
jgi:hypothetical protein